MNTLVTTKNHRLPVGQEKNLISLVDEDYANHALAGNTWEVPYIWPAPNLKQKNCSKTLPTKTIITSQIIIFFGALNERIPCHVLDSNKREAGCHAINLYNLYAYRLWIRENPTPKIDENKVQDSSILGTCICW